MRICRAPRILDRARCQFRRHRHGDQPGTNLAYSLFQQALTDKWRSLPVITRRDYWQRARAGYQLEMGYIIICEILFFISFYLLFNASISLAQGTEVRIETVNGAVVVSLSRTEHVGTTLVPSPGDVFISPLTIITSDGSSIDIHVDGYQLSISARSSVVIPGPTVYGNRLYAQSAANAGAALPGRRGDESAGI